MKNKQISQQLLFGTISYILAISSKPNMIIITVFILMCSFINNSLGQDKEIVPKFVFWTVGNSVTPRLGNHWYKNLNELQKDENSFNCFLQAIATGPQTNEKILLQCGMSLAWLNEAVDSLISHNCLGKTTNSDIYSKIPIITNKEMKYLQKRLNIISNRVAKKIEEDISKVIEVYNESKSKTDPNWEDISHLVVDKLAVPFIQANTIKVFQSDLEKIGNDAAEIVFENFSVIMDSYQKLF